MALITKTLMETGGDYSAFVTWQSLEQTDLPLDGDNHLLSIEGAWTGEETNVVSLTGWVADPTHFITIDCDADSRSRMPWSVTAFQLKRSTNTANNGVLDVGVPYTVIKRMQIWRNKTSSVNWNSWGINLLAAAIHCRLEKCYFRAGYVGSTDEAGQAVNAVRVQSMAAGSTLILVNCMLETMAHAGHGMTTGSLIDYRGLGTLYVYGCTLVQRHIPLSNEQGINVVASSSVVAKNVITEVTGVPGGTFCHDTEGTWTGSNKNTCSDNTTQGTNPRDDQVFTFAERGVDWHLDESDQGGLSRGDPGEDMSSDPIFAFNDDFEDNLRTDWNRGAFEVPVASGLSGGRYKVVQDCTRDAFCDVVHPMVA